ncbi:MAG TPA: hypothetical protein VN157_12325 [Caulobacter sp.]|nr:hypothetical protein [Caulobacter sp.]
MTSPRYLPQGPGAIVPGLGIGIVELLEARDGLKTLIELEDGQTIEAHDSAAGRDMGDEWEHVTFNASPSAEERDVHFVMTSEILRIIDPINGATLYERDAA